MSSCMHRSSYESLIKQIVYIEENLSEIASEAAAAGSFASASAANEFFGDYIGKVESLFKNLKIVDKKPFAHDENINRLPFIVLDSSFSLTGSGGKKYFCHLSYDIERNSRNPVKNLYFLSKTGMDLLLKEEGEQVQADIGEGIGWYTVGPITIQ